MRSFASALLALAFCAFVSAQTVTPTVVNTTATVVSPGISCSALRAGKEIRDVRGRIIHNHGQNANGSVKLTHSGRIIWDNQGNGVCTGDIQFVTNPTSQGSDGPISIHTNGAPTTITLGNGIAAAPVQCSITGGNATVIVGNHNHLGIDGLGNNVEFNGNGSMGWGAGPGSGGNVAMGGRGNQWDSGGGRWIVRN